MRKQKMHYDKSFKENAVKLSLERKNVTELALIICNLICLNTANVPTLVAVSFVAGIFRMWGTFMCNTTLAPWIFPKWTMPKFQCYLYFGICASRKLIASLHDNPEIK
jgi:hypothetical protein